MNQQTAITPGRQQAGSRSYAVIGAGAAGLVTAKYLKQVGFDNVTIFEIGSQIGGMWCYNNDSGRSSAYSTLHINSPRNQTRFEDFDFDPDVQTFPSHQDMHHYLNQYAAKFDLVPHIRFNSPVEMVSPTSDGCWSVKVKGQQAEIFDRVFVCTGHLSDPMDAPELSDRFAGQYHHAHHYRNPSDYVGKRVCVVGAGNSAFDIAADVCMTAERTVLVARSPVVIHPKLLFGKPYRDTTVALEKWWIPEKLRVKLVSFLVRMIHGDMQKLGFKPLPGKRIHNTSNPTLALHIAYERVKVKQGIDKVEGTKVTFVDGSSEEFDVMIAATGYQIKLPFIDPSVIKVEGTKLDLYRRIMVPGHPGIYFIGFINTSTGLPYAFERQVKSIIPFETGEATIPPEEEMRAAIRDKQEWLLKHYYASPRMTLEEPHVIYFGELQKTVSEGKRRRQESGAKAR